MKLKTVRYGYWGPASDMCCTATDCKNDAVVAVLVDGEFDGHAYCRRRGHRAEVLADAVGEVAP